MRRRRCITDHRESCPRERDTDAMSVESVIVARYAFRHEAETAQGFLENANVPCVVFVDDAGGAEPQLAYINGVRVVVPAAFADRARDVLRASGMLDEDS